MNILFLVLSLSIYVYSCKQIAPKKMYISCKNCIHFRPRRFNTEKSVFLLGKCTRFYEEDMTQKTIVYELATECRNDENKCGKEGKYFEPNDNKLYKMKNITRWGNSNVSSLRFKRLYSRSFNYF